MIYEWNSWFNKNELMQEEAQHLHYMTYRANMTHEQRHWRLTNIELTPEIRSRIEYLIASDNIILLS